MEFSSIHGRLSFLLILIILVQALVSAWQRHWLDMILSLGILFAIPAGFSLAGRLRLYIPPGLRSMIAMLVFAWLFLGYVHDYYGRFFWWDTVLHVFASSALGVMAFVLVHIFNKSDGFGSRVRAGLIALFAFVFVLAIGAVWEVFEFFVDSLFGADMQEAMLGDESGLTDTMSDLIADAVGALSVSVYGYYHLKKHSRTSILKSWVEAFIKGNPRLFGRAH